MSITTKTIFDNGFKRFTIAHLSADQGDDGIRIKIEDLMLEREPVHCPLSVSETEELIKALQTHVDLIRANW